MLQCAIKFVNLDDKLDNLRQEILNEDPDGNVHPTAIVTSKLPQNIIIQQLDRHIAMQEYYNAFSLAASRDNVKQHNLSLFPSNWSIETIETHLRNAQTQAMSANGSTLWFLKQRIRDPHSRKIDNYKLTNLQFLIAVRQQFGLGLDGLIDTVDTISTHQKCNACKNQTDSQGFHLLYSCHAQQADRSKRHGAIQRAYETLARRTGQSVSRQGNAPNVTVASSAIVPHAAPTSSTEAHPTNTSSAQKREYADWTVHDNHVGATIVFDNTNIGTFTQSTRNANPLSKHGHPSLTHAARQRRHAKYQAKNQGCLEREQIFLPLINTHAGGFIPQTSAQLEAHATAIAKIYGSDFKAKIGCTGDRPRSIEEALIRRWSRLVADTEKGGTGIYDATLTVTRAAGLLTLHTHRSIAYAAIRGSAQGAVHAIRRNKLMINAIPLIDQPTQS